MGKTKSVIYYSEKIIEFCLYLLAFFLPISKAVVEISIIMAFIAWVVKKFFQYITSEGNAFNKIREVLGFEPNYLDGALGLYIFIILISVFTSSNFSLSLRAFICKTMEYVILFFMVRETVNNRRRLNNVLIIFLISAAIVSLDIAYQYHNGLWQMTHGSYFYYGQDFIRHRQMYAGRVTGPFSNPNDLAGYLVTILPLVLCFGFFNFRNKKLKILTLILSIVMVGLLIINVSKGAWISFLVALFFLGLWKRKIFTYTVVVFLILVLITPLFFRLALNFSQFFHALFTLSDASSLDRKEMWEGAMNMIKAKPVFGHGPSTFMANFEKYRPAGYSEVVYAHNCYLQIAAESGIFALLAFSWMIALFFFRSIKAMVKIRDEFLKTFLLGLLGGILAFLIHSGVDTDMYQLQLVTLFWFSLGLAVAVQKIWEREKLEPLKILKQKKLSGV